MKCNEDRCLMMAKYEIPIAVVRIQKKNVMKMLVND